MAKHTTKSEILKTSSGQRRRGDGLDHVITVRLNDRTLRKLRRLAGDRPLSRRIRELIHEAYAERFGDET